MSQPKFGMVLVFKGAETIEEAQAFADALRRFGIVDDGESSRVHAYLPEHGGPVWYTP